MPRSKCEGWAGAGCGAWGEMALIATGGVRGSGWRPRGRHVGARRGGDGTGRPGWLARACCRLPVWEPVRVSATVIAGTSYLV